MHSGLAMTTIAMVGSPEQRARYLPRMARCEVLGAFPLTEPQHGSDVVALETRARRVPAGARLAKARTWDDADYVLAAGRTARSR